ncbi:MAG: hypothetical protein LBT65_04495 [Synergistaceae bacterium]|jgi:hypothetical protein|nr:hypothetical protein [Synergistaceae bacterium]
MPRGFLRAVSFAAALFAAVVSVDISPDARGMLLARGKGEKDAWIANVFYSCVQGNAFAMVRNGVPEATENYDLVDAGDLSVYVPKDMAFENDTPRIVVFPRKTGNRDVGVANVPD